MTTAIAYLDESTASGWGPHPLRLPGGEGAPLGLPAHCPGLLPQLQDFFGRTGKTPDQVSSQDVFAWAYGVDLSGKQPGSITIGARLACLSSFYRLLIRMKVVLLIRMKVVASNP
jgi:hypothetical protein